MKKFFSKEVVIGLAVVVSLCLLYWGINYLKGINLFTPANFYYVKYANINGLTDSAPVTINGFQVGLVREIKYDYANNGQLVVQLSLDKDLKIPVGSQASVVTDMLGTATVALTLSNEKTYYEVGSELPGAMQAGLMDNVTNQLLPSIAAIMPKIDSILTNLNAITSNPALNASVSRLDNITANLEKSSMELNSVLSRTLPVVMNNAAAISGDLRTVSGNLTTLTNDVKNLPIDSTMNNLCSTTRNLNNLTTKLNSKDSSLGLLLNDSKLYDHADKSVVSLDSLLIDFRKNPKRYVTFKVF